MARTVPYAYAQRKQEETLMWILVNVAMLVLATLIAGAAAVGVYWLLLRATVEMMRPAAAPIVARRQRVLAHPEASFKEGSK